MRILVTGASGWVGGYCAAALADAGHEVVGLDRSGGPGGSDAIERMTADLLDSQALERALRRAEPERVVHLAGETGRRGDRPDLNGFWEGNVVATRNLVRALSPSCGGVLVVSSAAVYGEEWEAGQLTPETARTRPTTWYGVSKAAQERVALIEGRARRIPTQVVRIFNLIGPDGPPGTVAYDLARELLRQHRAGDPLELERVDTVRDFVDVRDAVEAIRLLLDRSSNRQEDPTWNVCSARPVSVGELAATIAASLPTDPELRFRSVDPRQGDVLYQVGDPSRVQADTGWEPRLSLERSVSDLVHRLIEEGG